MPTMSIKQRHHVKAVVFSQPNYSPAWLFENKVTFDCNSHALCFQLPLHFHNCLDIWLGESRSATWERHNRVLSPLQILLAEKLWLGRMRSSHHIYSPLSPRIDRDSIILQFSFTTLFTQFILSARQKNELIRTAVDTEEKLVRLLWLCSLSLSQCMSMSGVGPERCAKTNHSFFFYFLIVCKWRKSLQPV